MLSLDVPTAVMRGGIHLAQLHPGPRVGRPLLRQVVQERRRVLQVPAQGQPRGTEVRLAGSLPGREYNSLCSCVMTCVSRYQLCVCSQSQMIRSHLFTLTIL
ncbi:hypothetical protein CEXT_87091 [Caerostris extrusa]|uniref:Uncharacterized protein n=1 Tax=Caerostris extrusa TaxID=172846 RepID=A0AAV4T8P7_CAEEX|nr:hypothetical protein CEXT_87091 [Caerostris extrusa]